jgi:hypothetical protein
VASALRPGFSDLDSAEERVVVIGYSDLGEKQVRAATNSFSDGIMMPNQGANSAKKNVCESGSSMFDKKSIQSSNGLDAKNQCLTFFSTYAGGGFDSVVVSTAGVPLAKALRLIL